MLCFFLFFQSLAFAQSVKEQNDEPSPIDAVVQMKMAWEKGRDVGKSVMVVLGTETCDRCALLARYMRDEQMRTRIEDRFIVLNLDVGSPDSTLQVDGEQRLPAIVLVDSANDFDVILQSNQLLTFLPEPYEPIFEWIENVLDYTEQPIALNE